MISIRRDRRFHVNTGLIYAILPYQGEDLSALSVLEAMLKSRARGYAKESRIIGTAEDLYALEYHISHEISAQHLLIKVRFAVVDDEAVGDSRLFAKAIKFIHTLFFDDYRSRYTKRLLKEQKRILTNMLGELENRPTFLATNGLWKALDPQCEMAINSLGTIENIAKVSLEDVKAWHQKVIAAPKSCYLIGPIRQAKAKRILSKYDRFEAQLPALVERVRPSEEMIDITSQKEVVQSRIAMAYRVNGTYSREVWSLFNTMLGDGGNAKLFSEIREKRGLCYSINSQVYYHHGYVLITAGVDQKRLTEAKDAIMALVQKLGFKKIDLRLAQAMVINQFMLNSDSAISLLRRKIYQEQTHDHYRDGEKIKRYRHVTLRDVKALAASLVYQGSYLLKGVSEQ